MKNMKRIILVATSILFCLTLVAVLRLFTGMHYCSDFTSDNIVHTEKAGQQFGSCIRFEKNIGQTSRKADFICRGKNHIHFITPTGSVLKLTGDGERLQDTVLRMNLTNSDPRTRGRGVDEMNSRSNYFKGRPEDWLTDIPHFARVKYDRVFNGVDLIYYIKGNHVEFDFLAKPGANPECIRWTFEGAEEVTIGENGDLIVSAGGHEIVYKKPAAWQNAGKERISVEASFAFREDRGVGFELDEYDRSRALTIDPELVYSTYLGGSDNDSGGDIAVGSDGCAVITGTTRSADFPTYSAYQSEKYPGQFSSSTDVFITKFNAQGTDILFSTYLGGRGDDNGNGIDLHDNGNIYITGSTTSYDDFDTDAYEGYPLKNEYQTLSNEDEEAFVSVLSSGGSTLIYSTYWGGDGEDRATDIAVGSDGRCSITGVNFSYNIPIKNAVQPSKPSYYYDPFAARFNPDVSGGSSLVWSTYLGGSYDDYGYGVAVDDAGNTYVTGEATQDFPVTTGAIQTVHKGGSDVFVAKIPDGGLNLEWATYLGSTSGNDEGKSIEVGPGGDVFVCGRCGAGFPTTQGTFQTSGGAHFLCKIKADGSGFSYSTLVPSSGRIAVDDIGQVYVEGSSAQQNAQGQWKSTPYLLAVNAQGSDTLYTLYHGGTDSDFCEGIAVDSDRSVYIVGHTSSTDLPVKNAFQTSLGGKTDVFVAKFGQPYVEEPEYIVKVLKDPLGDEKGPLPGVPLKISQIDLSDPSNPDITYLETQITDSQGLLHLSSDSYWGGMPILLQNVVLEEPAVKDSHTGPAGNKYTLMVDNLIIDKDGHVSAQCLENDMQDTTQAFLSHTSMAYNLIVSIEWAASEAHVNNLMAAFRQASNLLFDITNGQAYYNYIAIYDDGGNWKDADIQIHAYNDVIPQANTYGINSKGEMNEFHIFLPCNLLDNSGDETKNIQMIYDEEYLNPNHWLYFAVINHEFGHYAFAFLDEYRSATVPLIQTNTNYGFMDTPEKKTDPRASEMSSTTSRFYKETHQYQYWGLACWDMFSQMFSSPYGEVPALIHRPEDVKGNANLMVEGPNSDLSHPDYSVGSMMTIDDFTNKTDTPRRSYQVTSQESGNPIPSAKVQLRKNYTDQKIDHGLTTRSGHIKLFDAETGDKIFVNAFSKNLYRYRETLVGSSLGKMNDNTETIELKTVTGDFKMLSSLSQDWWGDALYTCQVEPFFSEEPTIEVTYQGESSDEEELDALAGTYSALLPVDDFKSGSILFRAPDSSGESFFIFQDAEMIELYNRGYPYISLDVGVELILDYEGCAEYATLLASDFPPPETGLPDSVLRISDVIALEMIPEDTDLSGSMLIFFNTDTLTANEAEAITVYKWEEGWIPLESSVNLEYKSAIVALDGSGHYAAFLDLTRSRPTGVDEHAEEVRPTGFRLYPNAPNPYNPETFISFDLPESGRVKLEVFDLLGRRVAVLVDEAMTTGNHQVIWNARDHAGGVYICRLTAGHRMANQKMVLMK